MREKGSGNGLIFPPIGALSRGAGVVVRRDLLEGRPQLMDTPVNAPQRLRQRLPNSRIARIVIGVLLIVLGLLGFLPVLGFWMIPLGLIVLSVDLRFVRRARRRLEIRWGRWRRRAALANKSANKRERS